MVKRRGKMNYKINTYQLKRCSWSMVISIFRTLLVLGVCYLLLFPLIYLIISSVQDPESTMDTTVVWVPKVFSGINFKNAIERLDYGNSFGFSLFISVISMVLTIISCSMVGYGLARFNFFSKKIAFTLVILLIIVPPQTTMMSTYLNFRYFDVFGIFKLITGNKINMLGSPLTMFLPAVLASGIRSGLSIFIFRQFFLGQPKELEEAAKIDGCGVFQTFVRIMMPLAVPAIITVAVFSFVWYWNDSFYGGLFFESGLKPLAVQFSTLRELLAADTGQKIFTVQEAKGALAASSLLCVMPPLILYAFIQRKFVESVERTGIVG